MGHALLFVLLPKKDAKSSKAASRAVIRYLDENGFAERDGRWRDGPADWFTIAGRWSGELTRVHQDPKKEAAFWKEFERQKLDEVGPGQTEAGQRKKACAFFRQYFPGIEPPPLFRDAVPGEGSYDDNAMIVDETIWKRCIRPGLRRELTDGGAVIHTEGYAEEYRDEKEDVIEANLKKKDVVGKCWVVLVDFHY